MERIMRSEIQKIIQESIETQKKVISALVPEIEQSAKTLIRALKEGKKVLVCGNGGSAADAQHFAAELTIRFEKNRKAIPAIALDTNVSSLTACANDFAYENIFQRQVEALGREGDVLVGITTSGGSKNITAAFKTAKEMKLMTICLNGKTGGEVKELGVNHNIIIPSMNTARIQEAHITILHVWCKLIEESLFKAAETSDEKD